MSSLRIKCIEYIRQEGNHLTYQEIAAGIKEGPQKVRTALADASKEGYIKFGKDESTGQGGYSLTGKGSSYLQNNKFSINGKSVAVNTAQSAALEAEEHKRALAAKPAKQAKPTPKAPKATQVEDEKTDAPEAGALLLSLANKELHDQLAGLAEMAKNIKKQKAELEKTLAKKDAEIKELHSALFNAQEQINLLDEQIAKSNKIQNDEGVLSYMLADFNGEYIESNLFEPYVELDQALDVLKKHVSQGDAASAKLMRELYVIRSGPAVAEKITPNFPKTFNSVLP
jgi:hypothetical protein